MDINANEIWKDCKGYEGKYQVSNEGRIWSIKRQIYLKQKDVNGYKKVCLMAINGKKKFEYVHRLVALAFLDNPNGYPEVDHIDRDRGNNNLENLRWVSKSENNKNKKQYDKKN